MDYRSANTAWQAAGTLAPTRLSFLKKVYALFTASLAASAAGAWAALHVGSAMAPTVSIGGEAVAIPPLVLWVANHPWLSLALVLGAVFGASAVRHKPGVNVAALFGMAGVFGVVMAPALYYAQLRASSGMTLSASPIRDAFLLSVLGFGGLTAYALTTKKDFSFLGGALTMGLFVVIGAAVLNMFLGSSVLALSISSVAVLLFGAYVLYDTSRLLRSNDDDAVGGAIQLYLDFVNIFLSLLRILSSDRR